MINMGWTRVIFIFLTLGVIIANISCQKKESHTYPEVTLAFWSDRFNMDFAKRCVNVYNTLKEPTVPIRYLSVEGRYTTKLLTLIAAGMPPDIMLLMPDEIGDFVSRGAILDLTPFFNTDSEIDLIKKDIWTDLLEAKMIKGKDWGAPIWTNSIALFYNKDIFDAENLSYPDVTWDWDKFIEGAQRLTKDRDGNGRIDQFGFGGIPYRLDPWYLHTYIRQNGGDVYNKDKTESLVDSPESIEAIQWVIDLANKYHVVPTMSEMASDQFGSGNEIPFITGKVAMVWGGRWMILPISESAKFEWSVAPLFHGREKVVFSAPVMLSVSSSTRYPRECLEFLKFMMGKEGQKLIINDRSEIPVLKSLAYSSEYLNRFNRPIENEVFVRELEYAEPYPYVLNQRPWLDESKNFLESAALGKITVKEACQKIAKNYNRLIASGEIKP